MDTKETTESDERLVTTSDLARYANASKHMVQKALDALGYQPINLTYNKKSHFYPESIRDAVKKWVEEY